MPAPLKRSTHMVENYIHYVFAFEFNHVGFIRDNFQNMSIVQIRII